MFDIKKIFVLFAILTALLPVRSAFALCECEPNDNFGTADAIQMGKVVDALPQRPNDPGILMVNAKFPSANRFNTIYKSQVAEAVAKGWNVVNSSSEAYEGTDPVFGSGDANMNNMIDKWDIEIVVDYILGLVPDDYPGFDLIAADVNGDGRITIADVTLIIEKIKSSAVED